MFGVRVRAYLQPGVRGVERAADRVAALADARADHAGRVGGGVRAAHQPDNLLGILHRNPARYNPLCRHRTVFRAALVQLLPRLLLPHLCPQSTNIP